MKTGVNNVAFVFGYADVFDMLYSFSENAVF